MSAAIQLVTPKIIYPDKVKAEIEPISTGSSEQRLRRAIDQIRELQEEVRTLHSELARAERALSHRDTLLRNATLRELELRAELLKEGL